MRARLLAQATTVALVANAGCGQHEAELPRTQPIEPIDHDALFVVNGADDSISVIDTATRSVVGTIELVNGRFPHHINLSPDRSTLVLAVPGADFSGGHGGGHSSHGAAGALLHLDALTGTTLDATALDAPNHNGVFSSNGLEIWTSQMVENGKVLVLDANTLQIAQTLPAGGSPAEITFSPDGRFAFAANTSTSDVTVYDASTKAVVATVPVGQDPVGAWAGRNNVMYVDNEASKSLTAIDARSHAVLRTYQLGFTPAMAAVAPNGELWVTDTEGGKVVRYATDADIRLGEIVTGAGAHAIAFSSDDRFGYITNQDAGSVSVIDVTSRAVVSTITVGSKPNGMVFRRR